ncbi:MAG: ABC transporter permease [Muribaculum sp.]|nr:ABC transporter permease [Muribaculum sp.]
MTAFMTDDSLKDMQNWRNLQTFGTVAEGEYLGVMPEDYEKLKESAAFTDISYRIYLGSVAGEGGVRTEVYYAPEKAADWCFHGMVEGQWPMLADELVVDEIYASDRELKTGDLVELDVTVDGHRIQEEFRVSGICSSNRVSGISSLFVSEAFAREAVGRKALTVYCRFPYTEFSENLLLQVWKAAIPGVEPVYHLNAAYSEGDNQKISGTNFLLGFLFFVVVYLAIYTLYSISLAKDVKLFACLKMQGVTAAQCATILWVQFAYIYSAALALGVCLGVGVCKTMVPFFMNDRFQSADAVGIFRWENILYAAAIVLFAGVMGVRKPLKILRKMPPIHAAVFSEFQKNQRRSGKAVKMSIFRLALRGLGRNPRRFWLVSMSTFAAVFLFTCIVNLVETETASYIASRQQPADFLIGTREFCNYYLDSLSEDRIGHSPFSQGGDRWSMGIDLVNQVERHCPEAQIQPFYYTFGINLNEEISGRLEALLRDGKIAERDSLGRSYYEEQLSDRAKANYRSFWTEMRYYVNFDVLEECRVLEGTLDEDKFESGNYVVMISNQTFAGSGTLYHVGETVCLDHFPEGVSYVRQKDGYLEIQGGIAQEYEVMAVVDQVPLMCAYLGAPLVIFLPACNIPEEDGMYQLCAIGVNAEDTAALEPVIKQIVYAAGEDLYYLSYEVIREEAAEAVRMIWILGGSLALVVAAMAGINFVNYMLTGIMERTEELTILRAIGMTQRQLCAMLRWENLIVSAGAALCGFGVGMAGCGILFGSCWTEVFQVCKLNPIPGLILIVVLAVLACVCSERNARMEIRQHD